MKLSKLTLHGYKTFASKTTFEFNEGITAIVGPNGSGKSNIADAIRWVLGEQSYGTLRGKRTADMIFAGSQQRPRAGMAQAVLTLDNSAGWIPLEFSEIEIGRRAYRSGENEYLLNGQKVRLRDVIELLASSGLAQHNYTIISQGLVDQALSLRADERRLLFEGAAGISQYKLRRAETIRRLQETNHNLERLHDILSEIKPRLNNLRRQANRAKNYGQIAADLKYHLRIWYGYRWEEARQQLSGCRVDSQKSQQKWEQAQHQQATVQEQMDELRGQAYELQQALQNKEEERNSLRDRIALERQTVAVLKERQDSIKSQLDDLSTEIPAISSQHKNAFAETNRALSDLEVAQVEFDEKQAVLREFESNSLSLQSEIKNLQKRITDLGQDRGVLQAEMAEAHGKKALFNTQIERLTNEPGADGKQKEAEAEVERLAIAEHSAKDDLNKLRQKAAELRVSQESLKKIAGKLQSQYQIAESKHNQRRYDVITLRTRLDVLNKQRGQVPEISGKFDIIGQFSELLFIPDEYRTAITAVLTHKLATYAVPDSKSFWRLLKEADGLPISVVNLGKIKGPEKISVLNHKNTIGWADSLVNPKEAARGLVNLLLGHVLIVHDASTAYDLAFKLPTGAIAVALDGFVAYSGGLVQIGIDSTLSHKTSPEENFLEIQEDLEKKTNDLGKVEEEMVKVAAELEESSSNLESLNKTMATVEQEEKQATYYVMESQRSRELAAQHLQFISRRIETTRTEIVLQRKQLLKLDKFLANKESETEKLEIVLMESRQELQTLPVAETNSLQEHNFQRIEASRTILAGRQAVVDSRTP